MVTKDQKEQFSKRLNDALDAAGFPVRGRAARLREKLDIKISEKGVRKWLVGEAIPETKNCSLVAKLARCNYEWLMTGRGPMDFYIIADEAHSAPGNPLIEKANELLEDFDEDALQEVLDFIEYKKSRLKT